MYNYISNYKGRTDLVDLYGDNSLLLYALQLRYDIEDIISVASEALTDGSDDKKCDLKLATTSSTGGLLLALQRAIVTIRPKGRYRKHFCWPAIKRYYSNLLVSILLLALLYTFELLHLLYCQSFQHNIL